MRDLKSCAVFALMAALSVQLVLCDNATTINSDNVTISSKRGPPLMMSTGNELWDGLISECLKKPTFSCIQKNVYTFLDATMKLKDVNITNRVQLTQNQVDYQLPVENDEENEIFFEGRATPIEEVSNALYDKGVKFLVTHDMNFQLPEILFDGATLRISPRSIEGNGIVAKLEYIPKTPSEIEERGKSADIARLFKKKIKKFFKKKFVLVIIAVILIIKIIKIKLFWLLPLLVGVGTAKKLVLKFLLFLFPALSHIFKLCGTFHSSQKTNFHHHKHNINHLHTVLYDGHEHHIPHDHVSNYIHSKPPKGHVSEYLHGSHAPPHLSYYSPSHHPAEDDWQSSIGLGSDFISDRISPEIYKPKLDAPENFGKGNIIVASSHNSINSNPLTHLRNRPYKRRVTGPSLPYRNGPSGPSAAASQISPQFVNSPIIDENIIKQRQEALRIQKEHQIIAKQQSILHSQPFVMDVEPLTPKPIDPFYSPILSKLDNIFHQMGYTDEACKERIVCNMYKDPLKYSPNSNYVSAELSRDSSELQRPVQSNPAVVRFYRYVQAARDGQDQRDCAVSYPCNIPTKKK